MNAWTRFDELQGDLQSLRNDVAKLIQEIPSAAADIRDDFLRAIRERVNRMQKDIDGSLSQIATHGREAAQAVNKMTEPVAHELEDLLHSHPFATIALAVGVGWLLGATWKR